MVETGFTQEWKNQGVLNKLHNYPLPWGIDKRVHIRLINRIRTSTTLQKRTSLIIFLFPSSLT